MSKIEIYVKNRNLCQKSKFLPKITKNRRKTRFKTLFQVSDELGGTHPCTVDKQMRLTSHLAQYSKKIKIFLVKIQEYVKMINLVEMPNGTFIFSLSRHILDIKINPIYIVN